MLVFKLVEAPPPFFLKKRKKSIYYGYFRHSAPPVLDMPTSMSDADTPRYSFDIFQILLLLSLIIYDISKFMVPFHDFLDTVLLDFHASLIIFLDFICLKDSFSCIHLPMTML